jgi:hypothetical protein
VNLDRTPKSTADPARSKHVKIEMILAGTAVDKPAVSTRLKQHQLAIGNDIFAQGAVDAGGLRHPVIEQLDPLFGGFVLRSRIQQIVSLHDDFESVAEIVRQTPNLFGLFGGDGGYTGRHSDLSRVLISVPVRW